MSVTSERFTLRDLPLPAKWVITCFLLAVGAGYTAAMVQLHFQDAKTGQPMPTVEDVVLKFTGKKWQSEPPQPQPSKFVKLLLAPEDAPFNGIGTMSPAFFNKCPIYTKGSRAGDAERTQLRAEREGERDVLVVWAEATPDVRAKAYQDDHFAVPIGKMPKAITPTFRNIDGAIKVKSILEQRCTRCHKTRESDDSKAANFPLENYAQFEKYLAAPEAVPFKQGGDWVKVEEPIDLNKLTQSTHAHLLSFAVLFSLTGLVFAFTSYPTGVRCLISPLVLVAIVTDVSFWWLARLCTEWGPYFAMGVLGTGGLAGLGLATQITLSLLNMYGTKGKAIILLIFGLAAAAGGLIYINQIEPGLKAKKARLEAVKADAGKKPDENNKKEKEPDKKDPVVATGPSAFDQVLQFPLKGPDGKDLAVAALPFDKGEQKNMVRAFFDKDGADYSKTMKDKEVPQSDKDQLVAGRHAELGAVTAWAKLPDAARKAAYDADSFALPPEFASKPFTSDYIAGGKVKIKQVIADRCVRCHADEEKAPFTEKYDSLLPYLQPKPLPKQ